MGDISASFDRKEFACACNCGFADIDMGLVNRLQAIRYAMKGPITIKSGCRCAKHNAEVGGSENSAHLRGKAADIHCPDSAFRYKLLKQCFKLFYRIEVPNGSWVHVDVDETLPQDVCFTKS